MSSDTRRQRVTNRQEVLILSKLEQLSAVERIADVYPRTRQPHPQQRVALAVENGYNLKFYYPATNLVALEDVKWDVFPLAQHSSRGDHLYPRLCGDLRLRDDFELCQIRK